ncbi:hypothetical protein EMCRGX_G018504 [Ephydatia muelleri]
MSYAPWYLQANKLKYTFGADSDLVVGEVVESNGGHTIHIQTANGEKAIALQSIIAQSVDGLHVSVTQLNGSPYIGILPPPRTAQEIQAPNPAAGLIFSKNIVQFPYSGLGSPPFTLYSAIVADVFKDVITKHPEFAIFYATSR